jgi:hypothetical protein
LWTCSVCSVSWMFNWRCCIGNWIYDSGVWERSELETQIWDWLLHSWYLKPWDWVTPRKAASKEKPAGEGRTQQKKLCRSEQWDRRKTKEQGRGPERQTDCIVEEIPGRYKEPCLCLHVKFCILQVLELKGSFPAWLYILCQVLAWCGTENKDPHTKCYTEVTQLECK